MQTRIMTRKMTYQQQRLVSENIMVADKLALKFGQVLVNTHQERSIIIDDLKQESMLGLCEAAMRYDSSKNTSFMTLAYYWCQKYVMNALRKYSQPLSVGNNFNQHVEGVFLDSQMIDVEEDTFDSTSREAVLNRISDALGGLSESEQLVISYLYGLDNEELSGKEVASVMGITPTRVTQLKQRALHKLKK